MTDASVVVRQALPADLSALAALAARTFPLACPPHTTPENIERHIRERLSETAFAADMADTATEFEVADQGGDLVGFTMTVASCPPPDGDGGVNPMELRRIYVDADRHGAGVGGRLMGSALERAGRAGHDVVWLGTNQHNGTAIAFYRRHGFEVIGVKTFVVGDSVEEDFVMARSV